MIDLSGKIQSPQGHAKQKPHPGHDAVAIANAHTGLGQVQLKAPDILSRRRVRGAVEKHSKPLAAVNVAPLRARTELPRVHVLDHAMTERGDGVRTHRKLLSWVRLTTPRSSRQNDPAAIDDLYPGSRARRSPRRAIAQRFSALAPKRRSTELADWRLAGAKLTFSRKRRTAAVDISPKSRLAS